MTPRDIELVQRSFDLVIPISEQAARLFYARLFETAPDVRRLFKGDMDDQGRKLMATLSVVVSGLSNLETVLPAASQLARRHVAYGVRPEHYPIVGSALLWTLEQGLGNAFTPETAAAWAKAYTTLSSFMISEAYGATAHAGA